MAFISKDIQRPTGSSGRQGIIDQWIRVTQATSSGAGIALPATTTGQLFRVKGGRVVVKSLIGTVTTVVQAQLDNLKVSAKQLDNSSTAVGTAVDVAANVDATGAEVGGGFFVEGDGTAMIKTSAGAILGGVVSGQWVAPQGEIYLTASATNTGAVKWDIWYQPLDPGAYVEAVPLTAAGILQAAI